MSNPARMEPVLATPNQEQAQPPQAAEAPAQAEQRPASGDDAYQVFVHDEQTAQFFVQMKRGGRLNPTVRIGGIKAAIQGMPQLSGVRLLVVDVGSNTSVMADVEALAEVCEPGLSVIVIGDLNDIRLYRELIDAGIAEYIVKPLDESIFLDAVERALTVASTADSAAPTNSAVTAFVSSRGGVGGSTVALNCAATMAATKSGRTILLDLDMTFGSIALALDLEPGRGLREALEAPDRVDTLLLSGATTKISNDFFVMASEEDISSHFRPSSEAINHLINLLKQEYSQIVIDVPRDIACQTDGLLALFDRIVIVTDLSLAGLRDTNRMFNLFKEVVDPEHISLVSNRGGLNPKAEIGEREFEKSVGRAFAAKLPDDPKTSALVTREAKPVRDVAKGSRFDKALHELTTKIAPKDEADDATSKAKKKIKLLSKREKK